MLANTTQYVNNNNNNCNFNELKSKSLSAFYFDKLSSSKAVELDDFDPHSEALIGDTANKATSKLVNTDNDFSGRIAGHLTSKDDLFTTDYHHYIQQQKQLEQKIHQQHLKLKHIKSNQQKKSSPSPQFSSESMLQMQNLSMPGVGVKRCHIGSTFNLSASNGPARPRHHHHSQQPPVLTQSNTFSCPFASTSALVFNTTASLDLQSGAKPKKTSQKFVLILIFHPSNLSQLSLRP